MKVILLYKSGRPGAGDYFARMMPVGLGWIQATLKKAGFDTSLANLSRVTWARAESLLRREKPDLVGITLYTFNRHAGLRLARLARAANPRCTVIVGGPHATHVAGSILRHEPAVTAVALGEGEITMLEAARAVRRGRPISGINGLMVRGEDGVPVVPIPRETVADLDTLPFPAPHYIGHHLETADEASFIITSRGCPARCTFCNTPDFWGTRMRFRSPASMVEEIRYLKEKMGVLYVSIRDDTFTVHRRRVIEFCERMIESRLDVVWNCQSRVNAIDEERLAWMRRAGCDHVQYGIESGSPRLLKELAKDITVEEIRAAAAATRHVGLPLSIYLISGVPGETPLDFEATRDLLAEIRPHDGIVAPLAVFPGTRIYEGLVQKGAMADDDWIREKRHTLYCMEGVAGSRSLNRLVRLCRKVGDRAAYTRADLDRHKELLPDAFPTFLASGHAHEVAGDDGEALADYETILRFSPDNLWAFLRIAGILMRSGDHAGSALYLRQAAHKAPASPMISALLARSQPKRVRRGA